MNKLGKTEFVWVLYKTHNTEASIKRLEIVAAEYVMRVWNLRFERLAASIATA